MILIIYLLNVNYYYINNKYNNIHYIIWVFFLNVINIFLFFIRYKYVLNVSETPSLVNRTLPQGVKSYPLSVYKKGPNITLPKLFSFLFKNPFSFKPITM